MMCLKERIWCGTENVSLISNFNWNIFWVYAKMYVETFSSDIWNCRRGEHMTKRVTKKAERKTGQKTVQGRNRAVDALFQCKEPEGVGRDGKAE